MAEFSQLAENLEPWCFMTHSNKILKGVGFTLAVSPPLDLHV